jgi:hypothetical protein
LKLYASVKTTAGWLKDKLIEAIEVLLIAIWALIVYAAIYACRACSILGLVCGFCVFFMGDFYSGIAMMLCGIALLGAWFD